MASLLLPKVGQHALKGTILADERFQRRLAVCYSKLQSSKLTNLERASETS